MARKKRTARTREKSRVATVEQFDLIIRPVITEKTMLLMQDLNKVTVEVPRSANKTAIKDAFEAVFGVEVVDVRTSIVNSKPKRRGGRYDGRTNIVKKAVVTVKDGEAIDLFKE